MWAWLGLAGCESPVVPPPTPVVPTLPVCRQAPDNGLRIVCELERDAAGPVELRLVSTDPSLGDPEVVIPGNPDVARVYITALDLLDDAAYDWVLEDRGTVVAEGTVVLPPLPDLFRPTVTLVTAGPTSVERLLFPLGCGSGATLYVVDPNGRVRWYEPVRTVGFLSGVDFTDAGTFAVTLARTRILEYAPDGEILTDVDRTTQMERTPHHGLQGRNGRLLALDAVPREYPDGRFYLIDGVSEIGPDGGENVWDVGQILDPQTLPVLDDAEEYWAGMFPGAIDFGHLNSIDAQPDGEWIVSLKHLDTVLRIDPRGQVRWSIAGMPNGASFGGVALTLGSSAGVDPTFQYPHHPNLTPWGTLLVVDNGRQYELARILEIAVDEEVGTADVIRAWDLGVECPVQSSAYGLPDGTIVAACAWTKEVFELDDSGIRRRSRVSCSDGNAGAVFVRAQPVPRIVGAAR